MTTKLAKPAIQPPKAGRWYAPNCETPGVSAWGHRSSGTTPSYGRTTLRNPQFTETHFTEAHFTERTLRNLILRNDHITEPHFTDTHVII